jgi:hypothetical protein
MMLIDPGCCYVHTDDYDDYEDGYWDNHELEDCAFRTIMESYLIDVVKHGVKNFRVDNMTNNDFSIVIDNARMFNNDWKTARLTEIWIDANPHWNMYTCNIERREYEPSRAAIIFI